MSQYQDSDSSKSMPEVKIYCKNFEEQPSKLRISNHLHKINTNIKNFKASSQNQYQDLSLALFKIKNIFKNQDQNWRSNILATSGLSPWRALHSKVFNWEIKKCTYRSLPWSFHQWPNLFWKTSVNRLFGLRYQKQKICCFTLTQTPEIGTENFFTFSGRLCPFL